MNKCTSRTSKFIFVHRSKEIIIYILYTGAYKLFNLENLLFVNLADYENDLKREKAFIFCKILDPLQSAVAEAQLCRTCISIGIQSGIEGYVGRSN